MEYLQAFFALLNEMSPYLVLGFLIAGVLRAFVPERLCSHYLSGTGFKSVILAALVGIPLPLCSCGVLPTTVSLRKGGASRAASTSFLIATPQTGVDSIAATYSMLGLPFAVLRPVAALVTAVFGGLVVGRVEKEDTAEENVLRQESENAPGELTLKDKIVEVFRYGFFEMLQNIGRWLVLGLVIATLITVLLPDDFFLRFGQHSLLNMVVIVMIAVPMYVCATGSIPIAAALMLKGLSPGCALVLLMSGPAANFASMLVVGHTLGKRAMWTYLAVIVAGAMGFGLLVDYLPGWRETFVAAMPHIDLHCHEMGSGVLNVACSVLLLVCIAVALLSNHIKSMRLKKENKAKRMKEFKIEGMMCNHCRERVEKEIAKLHGVERVRVDLAGSVAYVEGDVADSDVINAVTSAGYGASVK